MEKFTLINKDRSTIKVFEPFEDSSKPSPILISYGCVYKRSSKPVMKGSRLLSIAVVLIWDIRYNPFEEDEDGI